MGPQATIYEQYHLYQPEISRRQLTTEGSSESITTEEQTQSTEAKIQYVLFVMAQIGGLYTFLKMIFGAVLYIFTETSFVMNTINKVRLFRMNKYMNKSGGSQKDDSEDIERKQRHRSSNKNNYPSEYDNLKKELDDQGHKQSKDNIINLLFDENLVFSSDTF